MAAKVEAGMILGVECASEQVLLFMHCCCLSTAAVYPLLMCSIHHCARMQEPYIMVKAASSLYQWVGEDEYTWMGWMRAGDWVIDTIKYEKYGSSDTFWLLTEKRFPIFQEDLRSIVTQCKPVAVRQSNRVQSAPTQRIELEKQEITLLEDRCMVSANKECKPRDRARVGVRA